jgi:nickel superoxide dismutase
VHPLHHQALWISRIGDRHHLTGPNPQRWAKQQAVTGLELRAHAVARHLHPAEPAQPVDRMRQFRNHLEPSQGASLMMIVARLLNLADRLSRPDTIHAHCDLPCGVYDPAQARIEAESVKGCMEKFNTSDDNVFKTRAVTIKEERADLVKHHLWVLWTDYFTPAHLQQFPELHEVFWNATKAAGAAKKSTDPAVADSLLAQIAEIDRIFWETKKK